jgi:hypothetical protein
MASKYKIRKRRKYQQAGMYSPNVIGPPAQNSTTNILYNETNPQVQEAAMLGFDDEVERLTQEGERRQDEIETQQELDENEVEANQLQREQKNATVTGLATTGMQTAKTMGWIGHTSKAAATGGGIGTVAALAGKGISHLSDDDDATKWNAGEVTGDIMSAAGTGAAWGSMIPGIGTAIGAGIGGLYGLGKGLVQRRKARREEEELRNERVKENREGNFEASKNFAGHRARARSAEVDAKTYSGYDLGRNTVARYGGLKRYI